MAQGKKSFILYCDQRGIFNRLSDEQAGVLIKHIFAYVSDEKPQADFVTELAFESIMQQLKRDLKSWETQQEQRVTAGKKSAEVRQRNATTVQRNSTTVDERLFSSTVNDTVTVNVTANVNENVIKKDIVVLQPPHPLITWIQTNTPKVQKLKQPLTNDECTKLLEDLKIDTDIKKVRLKDMLINMQNYKPLLTKNESANLTIRNWWKRETERETPAQPLNAIKMNDKPYTR
jgi:hypothetical protein